MIIQVHPDWRVHSDANGWNVEKRAGQRKNKQTSEPEDNWKFASSHGSAAGAVKGLFERQIRSIDSSVPEEIVEQVKEFKARAEEVLAGYKL